jgi:lysophospholipase L1-like esterase
MRTALISIVSYAMLGAASCGGKTPIQPPPPPPDQLQITCPVHMVVEATRPDGAEVHFTSPVVTGGYPPYAIGCEPESGSVAPFGDSTVQCTATAADMAKVSCAFTVTVHVTRTLARTRFLAFGDSITDGAVTLAPVVMLNAVDTYPYKLEQMLLQRYPTQTFVVSNQGKGGEDTREGAARLPSVLDAEKPEVLLLLEGVNAVWLLPTATQASSIRTMIVAARRRRVDVIIATLMPVSAEYDARRRGSLSRIRALNDRIFEMAGEFGLENVVDLFALFEANMHLLGADGLHPTLEGQTRIAEAFRDEIIRRYELR